MYIDSELRYTVLEKSSNEAFQALWVEIHQTNAANIICGVLYRQHNSPEQFLKYFEETAENLIASGKPVYVLTEANINLLQLRSRFSQLDYLNVHVSYYISSSGNSNKQLGSKGYFPLQT